jgi:hypothetical protein
MTTLPRRYSQDRMADNEKEPHDERTDEVEAEVWQALSTRRWRPMILDNLRSRGMSHAEAKNFLAKVEAKWFQAQDPAWHRRVAIIAAIGGFVIPWVTTFIEEIIKMNTNLSQEVSKAFPVLVSVAEPIADKITGIAGFAVGWYYTRVVKDLIGFPDAHRAANYGYYAACLTALVYTTIDFFSKYW